VMFCTNDHAIGVRQDRPNAASFDVDLCVHRSGSQTDRIDGVQVVLLLQE
jgi:hypothetical protein